MLTSFAGAQNFPSYSEVQQTFLARYNGGLVNNSARLLFEKRPEGWFVRQVEFFPKAHTRTMELWWNSADGTYQNLSFDKRLSSAKDTASISLLNDDPENRYNLFPYYGYFGWERDVLQKINASTGVLASFQKAMCFASLANSYLASGVYSYDTAATRAFQIPNKKTYNQWVDSSIHFLNEVDQSEPSFAFNQISIRQHSRLQAIKRSMFLSIYFGDTTAIHNLPSSIYRANESEYFDNILRSCPLDAVLLVSGDLDALPLLFLTRHEGVRSDITVVHMDWLDELKYVNFLNESSNGQDLIGVHGQDILKKNIEFIRVLKYNRIRQFQYPGENLSQQKVRLDGLPDNSYQIEDFDLAREYSQLEHLLQFVAQDFDNQMDNGLTRYKYFPTNGIHVGTDSSFLQWKINDKLLNRKNLILLDLISNAMDNRPICFVSSTPETRLLGINDLELRGLVYELVDNKHQVGSSVDGIHINPTLLYQNLLFDFKWPQKEDLTAFQYISYWNLHYLLIKDLVHREKYNGSLMVLNHFFEKFPTEYWFDAKTTLILVEYYFLFDQVEKGRTILRNLRWRLLAKDLPGVGRNDHSYWLKAVDELALKFDIDIAD